MPIDVTLFLYDEGGNVRIPWSELPKYLRKARTT